MTKMFSALLAPSTEKPPARGSGRTPGTTFRSEVMFWPFGSTSILAAPTEVEISELVVSSGASPPVMVTSPAT
jgi:hypothetical protein